MTSQSDLDDRSRDVWQLLEDEAADGCDNIQDLYSWSLNYDAGKGPFTLFLDLIGWTLDEYGETFYNLQDASLGYVELDKLGRALNDYSHTPSTARDYVAQLMDAESRGA